MKEVKIVKVVKITLSTFLFPTCSCSCAPNYGGARCDRSESKCSVNPCSNGGRCVENDDVSDEDLCFLFEYCFVCLFYA